MKKKQDRPDQKIKIWMIRNDLDQVKIAKAYGVGKPFVSQLIRGVKTSKGLVKFMVDMGCPSECFSGGKLATHNKEGR